MFCLGRLPHMPTTLGFSLPPPLSCLIVWDQIVVGYAIVCGKYVSSEQWLVVCSWIHYLTPHTGRKMGSSNPMKEVAHIHLFLLVLFTQHDTSQAAGKLETPAFYTSTAWICTFTADHTLGLPSTCCSTCWTQGVLPHTPPHWYILGVDHPG